MAHKVVKKSKINKNLCTVPDCESYGPYAKYCTRHHRQIKAHGKILPKRLPDSMTCQAGDCDRGRRSANSPWCEMHYYRVRRNGTLDTVAPRVPNTKCKNKACDRKAFHVSGLCRNCEISFKKYGDFENRTKGEFAYNWLQDHEVNYSAVHQRLRNQRGPARNFDCTDCGNPAQQWSYNHNAEDERIGVAHDGVTPAPFSPNLDNYSARCISCHKKYDLALEGDWRGKA